MNAKNREGQDAQVSQSEVAQFIDIPCVDRESVQRRGPMHDNDRDPSRQLRQQSNQGPVSQRPGVPARGEAVGGTMKKLIPSLFAISVLFGFAMCGSPEEPEVVEAPPCAVPEDCAPDEICSVRGACLPDGQCTATGDCAQGMVCDNTNTCVPGSDCGGQEISATAIPPNMLIALDRSCSMTRTVDGVKKWDIAVEAINLMTTSYGDEVRWGLSLFPDNVDRGCSQEEQILPIADGNGPAIRSLLTVAQMTGDPNYPNGPCVTNIDTAMEQAGTDPAFQTSGFNHNVMLITDGKQSACNDAGGDNGTEAIIAELYNTMDVTTYVVGFGGGVDVAQLNEFAQLGGAPLPGDVNFYQAGNAAELEAQLANIAGAVVSCDYALEQAPADTDNVYVFFDNSEMIARDPSHMEGWDYDEMTQTLSFYGTACDRLRNREVDDLDIVFGCPGPVVE